MIYYFTSDTHFGHVNIIKYCNRPFKNVEHMDKSLIRNWNARVKKNDMVFHLGDFAYRNSLSQRNYMEGLNGQIILIRGNHDSNNNCKSIIDSMFIHIGGHEFFLTHEPDWGAGGQYGGSLVICGHVHELWKFQHFDYPDFGIQYDAINVGVDVWNYRPITINEILKEYEKWKK